MELLFKFRSSLHLQLSNPLLKLKLPQQINSEQYKLSAKMPGCQGCLPMLEH